MPITTAKSNPQLTCMVTPEDACRAVEIATASQTIIVDFDGTLLLRNSTEEYLRCVWPRTLGSLALASVSAARPWRWSGSQAAVSQRDWFRVVLCTVLFPWTLLIWKWRAPKLAQKFVNPELAAALAKTKGKLIIASQGFSFILRPLIAQIIPRAPTVACSFWHGRSDRSRGKLARVSAVIGTAALHAAVAVTDNDDDAPLLAAVAHPCHVIWPDARLLGATADAYLPFLYMERIKRPGEQYLLRYVLGDDLPVLALATTWLSPTPLPHAIALLLLTASFWCIYELGYFENDRVGAKFEEDPKVASAFFNTHAGVPTLAAWAWALGFAALGLSLLAPLEVAWAAPRWCALLVTTRLLFFLYNHADKSSRKWLYLPLQGLKHFGFLAVLASNPLGLMLFAAHGLTRWIHYFFYRLYKEATGSRKNTWPKTYDHVVRLTMFCFFVSGMALLSSTELWASRWQLGAMAAWCVLRGWREIRQVLTQFHPINRRVQPLPEARSK